MQLSLDKYQTEPVEAIFPFQWQLSGLPQLLRRCIWWWTLNIAGGKRAKRVGTFFLTTLASKGVEIQDPPAFLTSNLTFVERAYVNPATAVGADPLALQSPYVLHYVPSV